MRPLLLIVLSTCFVIAGESPLAVSTSLPTKGRHIAQQAFDGKAETSFWSDRATRDGDDITITLPAAREVRSIQIATGTSDGKDKLAFGVLEISDDGKKLPPCGRVQRRRRARRRNRWRDQCLPHPCHRRRWCGTSGE